MKYYENKEFGILDQEFIDNDTLWKVPMRLVNNGSGFEVIITLFMPQTF